MFAFRVYEGGTVPLYSKALTLGDLEKTGRGPYNLWTAIYYVAM